MRLGIAIKSFAWPGGPAAIGPRVATVARTADEAGLDSLWAMDHFFQIPDIGPEEDPMLEVFTVLSYAAALTRSIRIGQMVTAVAYRHPAVLVKQVTSLDVLSGGRAYLGIGAAWNTSEAAALGIPFPPLGERFERLEETLRIAHAMWSDSEAPVAGEHYRVERPLNEPPPVQRPHPPILVGGAGERKTLRLVARYADACNLDEGPEIPHKLDVLARHCENEGRDVAEIEKTAGGLVRGLEPTELLDRAHRLREMGIDHWILEPHRRPWDEETLALVCELAPQIQAL